MKTMTLGLALVLMATVGFAGEGRIELSQSMMPFTITNGGSYLLTGNLSGAAGQNGITINADNVTLDLNGFSLVGAGGSLDGVALLGSRKNIAVKNGVVRGWGDDGIDLLNASNSVCRELRVSHNGDQGLRVGSASRVADCQVLLNGDHGVEVGDGSSISQCVARENSGHGFLGGQAVLIRDCVSRQNTTHGITVGDGATVIACTTRSNSGDGIVAGKGSQISNSVGYSNDNGIRIAGEGANVVHCTVYGNSVYGIDLGEGCSVIQCTGAENLLGSIRASTNCFVLGNNSFNSGTNATDSGILVLGTGNRIEQNHVVESYRGFDVMGSDNLIIRNSATDNTSTNFTIGGGNRSGAFTNNPDGAGAWDNLDY